jgi:hypothetical protein
MIQFSQSSLFSQYSSRVFQPDSIITPSICFVSVEDNRNIVAWDKLNNNFVDYFKIYRESTLQVGKWDSVGYRKYTTTSLYIDSTSEPLEHSYRYKISSIDKCGNETSLSNSHKTINLSILKNTNETYTLIWDEYEGSAVNSYRIYRGTTKDDLKLIDSTSARTFHYKDSYLPNGAICYQVEGFMANECNSSILKSNSVFHLSKSNIASNITTGVNTVAIDENIKINPNPFSSEATISLITDNDVNYTLMVYDLTGKEVRNENISSNHFTFNRGTLSGGLYFIELRSKTKIFRKKILIVK